MNSRGTTGAIVVVVLLAGCFGGPGGGSPTDTGLTQSPTATVGPQAPGIPGRTLENVSALLETHNHTLNDAGFVLNVTANNRTYRYRVASEGSTRSIESNDGSVALWSNGTVSVSRRTTEDGVVYEEPGRDLSAERMTRVSRLEALLTSAPFKRSGTTECDGVPCIELHADGSTGDTYTNFTADVRIDTDGVIRFFEAEYVRSGEEGSAPSDYRYEVIELGDVSSDRPDWIEEALAQLES